MMRKLTLTLALAVLFVALACGAGLAGGTVVSLNTATAEQLANIPDVNIPPALAQAIVDYREANGPFKTPESVAKVPGMTNDFLEMLNPVLKDGDVVHDPDAEAALAPSKC